jgi:hypothetical protein
MVTRGLTGRPSGSEPPDKIPRDSTSSTISRCLGLKPRSKRQVIHPASAATVALAEGDVSVKKGRRCCPGRAMSTT